MRYIGQSQQNDTSVVSPTLEDAGLSCSLACTHKKKTVKLPTLIKVKMVGQSCQEPAHESNYHAIEGGKENSKHLDIPMSFKLLASILISHIKHGQQ